MAAGITVKPNSAADFAQALDAAVGRELQAVSKREPRHYDMEVSVSQCTPELLMQLRKFEPFGPGSPAPVFLARDVRLAHTPRKVGKEGRHLRLSMAAGHRETLDSVGFGMGHRQGALAAADTVDVVFRVETECYRGVLQPRITLLDFWSDRH